MGIGCLSTKQWAIALSISAFAGPVSCSPLPRSAFASVRQAEYFASKRELTPAIADAIRSGHVLLGMDQEQVWVALGAPNRKAEFPRSSTEIWIYRAGRLHQDPQHLGTSSVRLVFVGNQLAVVEPF